jgi:hypothetical protein
MSGLKANITMQPIKTYISVLSVSYLPVKNSLSITPATAKDQTHANRIQPTLPAKVIKQKGV